MIEYGHSLSRRRILRASGAAVLAGGAFASTAAAESHLIEVAPTELALANCTDATDTVTVSIRGPPFGRTDVEVEATNVNAEPTSFRLSGEGDSRSVTIGPGEGTVTVTATLPRGDRQEVTVDVTCVEKPRIVTRETEITLPLLGTVDALEFSVGWADEGPGHWSWKGSGLSDVNVIKIAGGGKPWVDVTDGVGRFSQSPPGIVSVSPMPTDGTIELIDPDGTVVGTWDPQST